ncbi:MAG: M24 family metallopeptidase [Rickettsiales bacterium]|nr:M24 family metallopeptidase [Rickettsiales bacterium]
MTRNLLKTVMAMEPELAEKIAKTHSYTAEQRVEHAIARAKQAHAILDEIIAQLKPGVLESEIKQFALDCFARHGIERTWHPPYVRFGEHSLLTFMEKNKEDHTLAEDDIAFVDIGIVHDGVEGDAGRTVVFGNDSEKCRLADASSTIFHEAIDFWQRHNPRGIALYEHIYALADKMNVAWNLDPAGHLIGAFPHRGWKRGINHFPESVESGKWILEIQIKHKELPYGAFYENLLYAPT